MSRSSLCAVALSLAVAACGPAGDDDDDTGSCEGVFGPGDFVISEIQADLPGADEAKEWFEIYNATGLDMDLTGLTLVTSKNDLTGERTHVVTGGTAPAGGYFVFGGVLDEFRPSHVDYGYGDALGDLRNTNGRIALRCGATEIDSVVYDAVSEGASYTLDGAATPDYLANDDPANWCDGRSDYGIAGEFGTPGAANDTCSAATTCLDGGTARPIEPPGAGDLVITEVMPNPDAVGDADGEWFEVTVMADVDLNGLQVGRAVDSLETIDSPDCLRFGAGAHVLFARRADTAANGGLPEVDFTFGFSLTNSNGTLVVARGGVALDEIAWTSSPTGASLSLDPDHIDPADNDDEANWCAGQTAYGDGDLGTPGAANDLCALPGTCFDGGARRPVVTPQPGDLFITELMPDPAAVADAQGEWFEVYAARDVDLNGLEVAVNGAVKTTVTSADCVRATGSTFLVFARNADGATNGGLPRVDVVMSASLPNAPSTPATLSLGVDGTVIDQVSWTGAAVASGKARELRSVPPADASANDDADDDAAWCTATTPYGAGDLGTPGGLPDCN
ncbi:MAG: lamin tail domain-containing protein [Deltaproteobacteria bacterium]|nr:MAG: lamin tail domain-containing protein [Deltaproteobacteria bacterium]